MSDEAVTNLDNCGCCEDLPQTSAHHNRPGLPEITYRVGTHGAFLRRMLARLPGQKIPDGPLQGGQPLLALTTRAVSDPAIALLDAWACTADVLSFYQERIANEGFLRTATERRSVLELARAIGYALKPGVAASTDLVYIVDDAEGAPGKASIPVGSQVQSIPGPGQLPQTFETVEAIEALAEWNALQPQQTQKQDLAAGTRKMYLQGVNTGLQPGDPVLLVGEERRKNPGNENWDLRFLETVTVDRAANTTLVTWDQGLGEWPVKPAEEPEVYALRLRSGLFGSTAAEWDNLHEDIQALYSDTAVDEWPSFNIQNNQIDLESSYPRVLPDSWVALVRPAYTELYRASSVQFTSRTGFGMVGKVTRIIPDTTENLSGFGLRQTVAYAQSELLPLAEEPLARPLEGDVLPLTGRVPLLPDKRRLIISGKRMRARALIPLILHGEDGLRTTTIAAGDSLYLTAAPYLRDDGRTIWPLEDRNGFRGTVDLLKAFLVLEPAQPKDPTVSEVAELKYASETETRTTLHLEDPISNFFDRTTVTIYANVTRSTHGETSREVLGSGNGSAGNQKFQLKNNPLTYVSASTPSGVASTLEVRVNGVRWDLVDSLYGQGPRDRVYILRQEADGKTTVIFGDGEQGARLPSGQENVRAAYRSGIGLAGEVGEGSLSLLKTRPYGVRSVKNPIAASGAADAEKIEDARQNAPVTVLTLDRIVSLRDFEDFTRAFAGVSKARASALWNGATHVVHLSVATASGKPLETGSELYDNLHSAMDGARDPGIPLKIQGYTPALFRVKAKLLVDERYLFEDVRKAVEAALLALFAFASRDFAQPVTAAEVITAIQQVPGVSAVDLDRLYREGEMAALNNLVPAASARRSSGGYTPADLLLIHPFGIELEEMEVTP